MFRILQRIPPRGMAWLEALLSAKTLGRLTLLLVPAMTVACLWPFVTPANTASWVRGDHAVAFGRHGVLIGPGPLLAGGGGDSGCTIELWAEPDRAETKGALLAGYSETNTRLLRVEQFDDGLAVRSLAPGAPDRTGGAQLYAD